MSRELSRACTHPNLRLRLVRNEGCHHAAVTEKLATYGLRRGMTLILTHDGQPLACLVPIPPITGSIAADDPLYTLAEQEGCADGGAKMMGVDVHLTNAGIDRALYGG